MTTYKPASPTPTTEASATATANRSTATFAGTYLPPLIAIAAGIAIIAVIGFAGSDILHAAAHDLRHASGFPCH